MNRRIFFGAAAAASFSIIGLLCIVFAHAAQAINVSGSLQVSVSAQVGSTPPPPPPPPPPGGGGGGGGGNVAPPVDPNLFPTTGVVFIGKAYPSSNVSLLQNGRLIVRTISGPDATFLISISNATPGTANYLLVAEDPFGRQSSFTVPVVVTQAATTTVSGIYIAPTLDLNKRQVNIGDNLIFFGRSVPSSDVTIQVNSETELFLRTKADNSGGYLYTLDSSLLNIGTHDAKSKSALDGQISEYGQAVGFAVLDKNAPIVEEEKVPEEGIKQCGLSGDLNGDCRVNLIDFSILAYWYKRANPPTKIDVKKDKKIDLADFSVLASQWTG